MLTFLENILKEEFINYYKETHKNTEEIYQPLKTEDYAVQVIDDVREWTVRAYLLYPDFQALTEVVSEYNGKLMNAQLVLRSGSVVNPQNHIKTTYRNFFQSKKQWQFTGLRLTDSF